MALELFHCEDCGCEFRISPKLLGLSDELTCPICGEETIEIGPARDPVMELQDEDEGEDEELEEEEENPTGSGRRNPRHR